MKLYMMHCKQVWHVTCGHTLSQIHEMLGKITVSYLTGENTKLSQCANGGALPRWVAQTDAPM